MSLLQPDDLVFYKEDGKVMSAGYAVKNMFTEAGISPGAGLMVQSGGGKGGTEGGALPNYVVPTALLLLQQGVNPEYFAKKAETVEVIGEGLHSRLLSLANNRSRGAPRFKTRRHRRSHRNKTRKKARE